jgi:hypothetical protein
MPKVWDCVVVSSESACGASSICRCKLRRTFPMRCTTLLPPSVCLHKPNGNMQTRNALTSASTTSSQLHNFTTFLSATSNSAVTLAPPVPALSCAIHSAESSELAVIITAKDLLFFRLFTPSPLRFLLTPGEHPTSPHHAVHLTR